MTPEEFFVEFDPPCFYHFTDVRNVPSIRAHGLLSLAHLRQRNILVPAPGGNEWSHEEDSRRALDQFVHLCFFKEHPMEYCARREGRLQQTVFLRISRTVICGEGVRYTKEVANKAGSRLLNLTEAVEDLDFEVMFKHTNWRDPSIQERMKAAKKSELLVPVVIPPRLITFPRHGQTTDIHVSF